MASKKPQTGMRHPPKAQDLAGIDAFVSGTPTSTTPEPTTAQLPKQPGLHDRASGKTVRRTSLYLKPETALALKRYGVDHGEDMSTIAEDILSRFLKEAGYSGT